MAGDTRPAPARPGEDELIERFFRPMAGPAALGLLDDAACLSPRPGEDLVLTADALVAGVHFFPHDPPDAIGWKTLAVNLSDLAAKGAAPLGFLLTLALPPGWTADWLQGFADGLGACARAGSCPLLGGDTVRTPGPLTLSVTALGGVPAGRMVPRTGARPGDLILVSGTIGDAALGLRLRLAEEPRRTPPAWIARLDAEQDGHLRDRYLRPRPRNALAPALLAHARAGMDVSDGLVGDLRKMMAASGVGAEVDLARVPLSGAARTACEGEPDVFKTIVTGGDDYEVLCTVELQKLEGFMQAAKDLQVPMTEIGIVTPGHSTKFLFGSVDELTFETGSFSHF